MLTAMPVAAILFRPIAGYLLGNFNRYRVYLVFPGADLIQLYMGAVYSVWGPATMTQASTGFWYISACPSCADFFFGLGYGILQPLYWYDPGAQARRS